jgi:hypothetical protein
VKVFLDASVILAACGRDSGASRRIFDIHKDEGGRLMGTGFYGFKIMKLGDFLKQNQRS